MPPPYDDDDYEGAGREADVPFPAGVKAAGVIWIAFGVLGIAGNLISFAITAGMAAQQNGPGGPGPGSNPCGLGCGILFALAFLFVGIQTVKGTAKGTLGNGIGSIVFGVLYVGATALFAVAGASGQLPPDMATVIFVLAGFTALLAAALFTAGVLALSGQKAYAAWLEANGRGPRRRRRSSEEEDYDDDDRPRRRRRDLDEDDDR